MSKPKSQSSESKFTPAPQAHKKNGIKMVVFINLMVVLILTLYIYNTYEYIEFVYKTPQWFSPIIILLSVGVIAVAVDRHMKKTMVGALAVFSVFAVLFVLSTIFQ